MLWGGWDKWIEWGGWDVMTVSSRLTRFYTMQGLEGTIEKISPTLNANATYKKTSRISRLPAYLTVQFIRFFVGKAGGSDEMVAKKILKVLSLNHVVRFITTIP